MGQNVRNLVNGLLKIKDGAGTPNEITIPIDVGNLSWTVQDEAPVARNRGALQGFADPIEEPIPISFQFLFTEWSGKTTSGADISPADFLRRKNTGASLVGRKDCGPYLTLLEFTIAKPGVCTDALEQNEIVTFDFFRVDSLEFNETEEINTIDVTGRALITDPAVARA